MNLFNLLEDFHKRLLRLEQITMERQSEPIYTNIKFPTHDLPSSTKTMADSGLTNEVGVSVCSTCHQAIEGRFYICHHDHRVLCDKPSCALIYMNMAHCERDLRRFHIDISKQDYLVLCCQVNGFKDTKTIEELTRMSSEDIERSLSRLLNSNLLVQETRFFGLIEEMKVTDKGMAALTIYRYVYGTGEDVAIFGKALRQKLASERGFNIGLL